MKYAFASVAFGLGANALVARNSDQQQCYNLKASGGASGVLGQLDDGQNRVGGGLPNGCYCLGSNGGFTDTNGSGCILTPPTTQFQCDKGASPTTGFAIGSNGGVTYKGSGKFYACPVNTMGEYNIYSQPVSGQPKCVEISLSTAGYCGPSKGQQSNTCPAPSTVTVVKTEKNVVTQTEKNVVTQTEKATVTETQQATVTETQKENNYVTKTATENNYVTKTEKYPVTETETETQKAYVTKMVTVTETQQCPQPSQPQYSQKPQPSKGSQPGSCPANLNGNYQYPHLIIPVDSSAPHNAPGTSYNGKVNSHTCSIFNFDIPQSYSGKTCTLVFLFPQQKDLETSSFTTSGSGEVSFSMLSGPASQQTSWENAPKKSKDLGSYSISPGNSYTITSGNCAAGQTVTYEMCGSGDYSLEYFQDYNPSPIGLYIREC